MKKFTILLTLFLAFATAVVAQEGPATRNNNPTSPSGPRGGGSVLIDQSDLAINNSGSGIVSTRLSSLGAGTDWAVTADDFTVPSGVQWSVDGLQTTGFSNLPTAPTGFGVRIYNDNAGSPGSVVFSWDGVPATGLDMTAQTFDFSASPATLSPGTYWIQVHAEHNTAPDLGTFRWNWNTGPTAFGADWQLEDTAGFFGAPFSWTSATGLGITDVSAAFVMTGTTRALVPTLGEWGLIAFITLLAGSALVMARKRRLMA